METGPLVYGIGYDPRAGEAPPAPRKRPWLEVIVVIATSLTIARSFPAVSEFFTALAILVMSGFIFSFLVPISKDSAIALSGNGVEVRNKKNVISTFIPYAEIQNLEIVDDQGVITHDKGTTKITGLLIGFDEFYAKLVKVLEADPAERAALVGTFTPEPHKSPISWSHQVGRGETQDLSDRCLYLTSNEQGVGLLLQISLLLIVTEIMDGSMGKSILWEKIGFGVLGLLGVVWLTARNLRIDLRPDRILFKDNSGERFVSYDAVSIDDYWLAARLRADEMRPVWLLPSLRPHLMAYLQRRKMQPNTLVIP